jgi:hypothetical protein
MRWRIVTAHAHSPHVHSPHPLAKCPRTTRSVPARRTPTRTTVCPLSAGWLRACALPSSGEFEEGTSPLTDNFEMISAGLEARGSRLTETLLSSSEVRRRMTRRGADDIVRYGLRRGGSEDPGGANEAVTFSKSWYDEVEGLVPPSVRRIRPPQQTVPSTGLRTG